MVYIALKTHLKHILSLIALFLAFMFIINGVPSTLNTRIDSISVNEPEILYNRTMNIFKKNIEYIDRKEIGDISPDTIKELGERLNHILQMKLHKPGVSYEELKKTILKAYHAVWTRSIKQQITHRQASFDIGVQRVARAVELRGFV